METIEPWSETDFLFLKEVYKLLLDSRVNAAYYQKKLRAVMLCSFWLSLIITITANGSGLAALLDAIQSRELDHIAWLNANHLGELIRITWSTLLVVAAVSAAVRTLYAPEKRIEIFTHQYRAYQSIFNSLRKLVADIKIAGYASEKHRIQFTMLIDRYNQAEASDDCAVSMWRLKRAQSQAEREVPDHLLWWPPYVSASQVDSGSKEEGRTATVLSLKTP